jgi:hypothetical protein
MSLFILVRSLYLMIHIHCYCCIETCLSYVTENHEKPVSQRLVYQETNLLCVCVSHRFSLFDMSGLNNSLESYSLVHGQTA